jgi:hypothetical protein
MPNATHTEPDSVTAVATHFKTVGNLFPDSNFFVH